MWLLRYIWASPTTLVGLGVALLTLISGGRVSRHTGVLEVSGGFATWALRKLVPLPNGALAMTLGHVVIGRDPAALDRTRTHERVHVTQCERWGPFFIPAYFLASGVAWWRGEPIYRGNRFEREAYAVSG
ncbi:MAG: hypothetical protein AAGD32_14560 [Planctomycetota bacterium]